MRNSDNIPVSIITVCLNAAGTVEDTIKSVVGQTYENIEYIIIDGGSTDGTLQIIEKYKDDISVLVSEKDQGIYDAMNKGIGLAKGDYIGIINADDWYERDAVENVVRLGKEAPEHTGVIYGRIQFVEEERLFTIKEKGMDSIWTEMPIAHPSTFIRKSVYDKYGGYDTQYKIAADYDFIFKLYVSGVGFLSCKHVLANYRVGGISGTHRNELYEEDTKILKKYLKYCDNPSKIQQSIQRKEGICFFYQADRDILCNVLEITPDSKEKLFVFGCGYWGRELCRQLNDRKITVTAILDNNRELWGTIVEGCAVASPDILGEYPSRVVIAVQGDNSEIQAQITDLNRDSIAVGLDSIFEKIRLIYEEGRA